MQLNCETDELKQMALLIFGDKIHILKQRIAELEADNKAKDQRIETLEKDVKEREDKLAKQQKQIVDMSMKMNETTMTAWALQQFLVLSKQKANVYVHSVDNGTRAQIGQFMFQSLPDNSPPIMLEYVRMMTQPDPPTPPVIQGDYVVGNKSVGNEVNGVAAGGTGIHIDKGDEQHETGRFTEGIGGN